MRSALLLVIATLQRCGAFAVPAPALNIVCAGAAGAAGALAVFPIDTLKTRLQSEDGASCYGNGVNAAVALIKTEGPMSLYRGLGPQLTGVIPEKTIKLFVHDATVLAHGELLSGAIAGLCQVIVTNPLEIVKVRLQLSSGEQQKDAFDVMEKMGVAQNPFVLYQGVVACAARDSSFSAILFPCYAHSKMVLAEETQLAGALLFFVAGLIAAAPAAYLTTPFDLVKTRLQQDRGLSLGVEDGCATDLSAAAVLSVDSVGEEGAFALCRRIVAEEGPAVFFRGGLERVMRSAPQFGITLALYEVFKQACEARGWAVV